MSRPRISRLKTWEQHERRVLEVLEKALLLLSTKINLLPSEVELNRQLYFCLLEANSQLLAQRRGFEHPPISEAKNPPHWDDEHHTLRENKIPDFLWGYIDQTELDSRRQAKHFIIECKRLGNPTRKDWILNQNYVNYGVLRFIQAGHAYAISEKSAAMVGYVESMDFDDILGQINDAGALVSLPVLAPPLNGWTSQGLSRLEHTLDRSFLNSSLSLRHFWIDIRGCYTTTISTKLETANKSPQ